ncbi:MBL fold metallo-hydrolase [Ovoidimarina sediminis]|uniref:MBL fold metallo-hydrolase n=1 Tax=Ovoidimarina sediminis TaxID=3079856 RepID=UPI00290E262A|nr:MBL fold metallo-hydrolase [Rhodophyticola sp. MJ-SS7]MDU8942962.1 MBL fold metallo-hydrolase [Rhodophyticola sp. MJ-SS7]
MTLKKTSLSRRAALVGGASLPLAATLAPTLASAGGHGETPARSDTHRRFTLGAFEVTVVLAGTRTVTDDPQGTFGMNVDSDTFAAASAEHFIPADRFQAFFNPTVVKTGSETILFDTGLGGEAIAGVLATAGFSSDDIDTVVLTHMHGDHIGGLMTEGAPTFANARYVAGEAEYAYWTGQENERVAGNVTPLAEKTEFVGDGHSVASGVTSMAAFGHTPGHMVYMLDSEGEQLLITADLANHHVWSLAYPDWEVRFDIEKDAAAAARRRVLGMLAADRIPFIGYHMPFPGVGFVDTRGDGFHFVPETYQLTV